MMKALTDTHTTNLYDLFETVYNEVTNEEEDLVPSVVMHMINTGKIKLLCKDEVCSNFLN